MKVKLDENLSSKHKALLISYGYDVVTVQQEGLRGCSDDRLWREVCKEERFLLTLDVGFADARRTVSRPNPGMLLIRSGRKGSDNIARIIRRVIQEVPLEQLKGCLVVADERKTRIRKTL
jgi:predicted nuclease of predicted toxin-antitoxin system